MQIGPYQVLSELGRGGMGVVYEVRDPQGRSFALKRLRTESSTDDQLRLRRIGRELEALGRIQHPGVVRAFDSGWDSGAFYIVMELVRSPSLGAQLQRKGPLPPEEAAECCREVARTLHALHEQGILHRDVKPDNILVDRGRPRLTDLGLVQLFDDQEQLTLSGTTVGTPGFCAPELLSRQSGHKPTAAVDVYGLGATLYALLTGRPPFEGASGYEVAVQTLESNPTPPSHLESDPARSRKLARYDALVLRCLAKDPGDRYRSAGELASSLDEILSADEVPDSAGLSLLLPLGLLVILCLFLGAVYLTLAPAEELPPSPSAQLSESSRPSAEPPAPSLAPSRVEPPTPEADSRSAAKRGAAQIEDFLAEDAPAPRGPTPRGLRRVQGVKDLAPLGALADTIWGRRGDGWELTLESGGYVGLRSVVPDTGQLSIRYFELWRNEAGRQVSARVTVEVGRVEEYVAGGLVYGRTDQRDYYLLGVDHRGGRFVKHRSPTGLEDRLSGKIPPGPHSFGIKEAGQQLQVQIDGRMIMGLGGAVDPEARIGVFVIGRGLVLARGFEFELR